MNKWSKIFSSLLLLSLLLHWPAGTFDTSMPSSIEKGVRQSLLLLEAATEETIENEMAEAELVYKQRLSSAKKAKIHIKSAVWWLLLISAVGVLFSRQWGYYLLYGATVLNFYTSLCYLPLIVDLVLPWLLMPAGLILIQLVNLAMIAPLIMNHRKLNQNPNQRMLSIADSSRSE